MGFAELYDEHGAALYRRALARLGCAASAWDAVHAVFAGLVGRDLARLRDPEIYLHVALRHELARIGSKRVISSDGLEWVAVREGSDPAETERIERAIATLPPEQREVLVLHVWSDLSFARIAELLETSPNTIGSRYRYARKKLARELSEAPAKELAEERDEA